MPAQDVALKVVYKQHSTAVITPGTEPVFTVDPGATGGQELRRVSSSLNLVKSTFKSNEIRSDRQIYDFRHGGKRVTGEYAGELSPKTYQDFMSAVVRGTWAAAVSKDNTVFTNVTITSGVATVGASTWAAQGFKVGDIIRFSGLTVTANNGPNFQITVLSGTAATLVPAPLDQVLDATFSVQTVGRKLIPPLIPVDTKWFFEEYFVDLDISHQFSECRIGSMKVSMPAEGIATASFGVIGRNLTLATGASAPFFTAPTAPTTTGLLTSIGGQLTIAGVSQAIITGAELNVDINLSAKNVAFSALLPEIFGGELDVNGQLTAMFNDNVALQAFLNETEMELSLMLATSGTAGADYISFFMPRVKFAGANLAKQGMADVPLTLPFQALLKAAATGYDNTTLIIQDSLSA